MDCINAFVPLMWLPSARADSRHHRLTNDHICSMPITRRTGVYRRTPHSIQMQMVLVSLISIYRHFSCFAICSMAILALVITIAKGETL